MSSERDDSFRIQQDALRDDTMARLDVMLRQKDEIIRKMVTEIQELRKQIQELTKIMFELRKESNVTAYNDDSLIKDEGKIEKDAMPMDSSNEDSRRMEFEESQTGKKKKKNKRKKKTVLSASEEEGVGGPSEMNIQQKEDLDKGTGKSSAIKLPIDKDSFPPLPPIQSKMIPVVPDVPNFISQNKVARKPVRSKEIPPIVISNAANFVTISAQFKINNVNFSSAILVRNGVKIFPSSVDDFNNASALLDKIKEPYFTFRFPEEKLNHVVLRGAPVHLTKHDIRESLVHQGFNPKSIIRWTHSNGQPMPLVLVLLPKSETDIYKVKVVCGFELRVEAQKSRSRGIQCFNCQDFGHAAKNCHIPSKCLKCGDDHHTSKCSKGKEDPARCVNCGGSHPASFSGCPRHPSQVKVKNSKFRGWGTQDNSRLAPKKQSNPVQASSEALLTPAQLAQIGQMFKETILNHFKKSHSPV